MAASFKHAEGWHGKQGSSLCFQVSNKRDKNKRELKFLSIDEMKDQNTFPEDDTIGDL